jgi:hypothetical protein
MDKYLLLLHESAIAPEMSPEEMQAIIGRYRAWGQKLRDAGRMSGGDKLEDATGRTIRGQGPGLRITDGPYAETKDVVAGYFVIQAESYDDAVEWCKDCPHLAFGSIELRKIQVT